MRIEREQIRVIVLTAALVAVFVGALWMPRRIDKQNLDARIATAKAQLEADRPVVAALAGLSQDVGHLRQTVSRSRKHVPKDDELGVLLRQLSGELQANRAMDQEIQTQPVTHGAEYNVIPVTLTFRSPFRTTFDFVRTIESGRRLVRITRLELHSDPSRPAEPLRVNLDLCTYCSAPNGAEARNR